MIYQILMSEDLESEYGDETPTTQKTKLPRLPKFSLEQSFEWAEKRIAARPKRLEISRAGPPITAPSLAWLTLSAGALTAILSPFIFTETKKEEKKNADEQPGEASDDEEEGD